MRTEDLTELGKRLLDYCGKFNVPIPYLFQILQDQKVTPMIRGKAMEFNAYLVLDKLLPKDAWSVEKLNLNAQPGTHDEDISITHRRSGIRLKTESKSTVRGSIRLKGRNHAVPFFRVKSHRSRSNINLADTSNDRYAVDDFDVLITNTSNAVFQGSTIGETLEVVSNHDAKRMLYSFYRVKSDADLVVACENDWRFCIPKDIAENGFIPRTPLVLLENDPNWKPIQGIESRLLEVIQEKHSATRKASKR